MGSNLTAMVALLSFVAVAPALFCVLPPRRAVIAGFIIAWLFLPVAGLELRGLPDISKTYIATFGVMLGVCIFDPGRLLTFRPRWFDLPMLVWCTVPMASALSSGSGAYDGLSAVLKQSMQWGLPYFLGRIYFSDLAAMRDLAMAVVIGALLYVPFCLWEVRMSPNLHHYLYGYHPHSFAQHIRQSGYRPMVFMQHGLMVAMWMTWGTVCAMWLWRSGAVQRLWAMPLGLLVGVLFVTSVLCKSVGPLMLMLIGMGLFFWVRRVRMRWALWVVVAMVPLYITARATGAWSGESAVRLAESMAGPERARSLKGRLTNETLLVERALEAPIFGWGSGDGWRVKDKSGRDITTSDGLWVIALGQHGLVGLVAVTSATLLPLVLLLRRFPLASWIDPRIAPLAVLALLLGLWAVDNLLNAMIHPVYVVALGGVGTVLSVVRVEMTAAAAAAAPAPGSRQPPAARTQPRGRLLTAPR